MERIVLRALGRVERPGEVISPGRSFLASPREARALVDLGAAVPADSSDSPSFALPEELELLELHRRELDEVQPLSREVIPRKWPDELEPFRSLLEGAGIQTFDALLDVEDLTSLPGIGRARAARIREALGG